MERERNTPCALNRDKCGLTSLSARWVRRLRIAWLPLVACFSAAQAQATVVERVVAVVGERAILLSDLRERSRPFLLRIYQEVPAGAPRNAAISQTYKNLLDRMVDEELQQVAANRSKTVVDAREVEEALGRIASQNNMGVDQLIVEARRSGLDERQYRSEIKRQVLEAKLLNLRVQGRIRVTEEDTRSIYRRMVLEERRKLGFRAAWIRIATTREPKQANERRQLAERIAERARSGVDFAALAQAHSEDRATSTRGGDLGRLKPGQLPEAIDTALLSLDVGQVSSALRVGEAFYIVKVSERDESELPDYDDARSELGERVYMEKMAKARRAWLEGLRRTTHVEIRF